MIHKDREMSFEAVSERLKSLQDTNSQLRDLIDRLANINFQPGSIPLDDDENNVKVELTSEIHQIIKDQDEDLVILQEDIIDLGRKWASADLEQQKAVLDRGVKKALEDLKV
jgi:protein transport protein SEC20